MPDPLVLYLAGSIDARAGAELILERWPGAELKSSARLPVIAANKARDEGRHVWCLGFGEDAETPRADVTTIDPTPDASIAMQVWQTVAVCPACGGTGNRRVPLQRSRCPECSGGKYAPNPPTWLRYLDDAVCKRWALPDSRAWWEATQDVVETRGWSSYLLDFGQLDGRLPRARPRHPPSPQAMGSGTEWHPPPAERRQRGDSLAA